MTRFVYACFLLPISRLPLWALYGISNVLRFFVQRVFGYRLRVVRENVARSFPEKSEAERKAIVDEFYAHFCDLIVESIKAFTISSPEIQKRFVFTNPQVLDDFYLAGKSVILVGGHFNNWEWLAVALKQQMKHRCIGIYKPLSNRFLDTRMRETRSQYGLEMLPIKEVPGFFRAAAADRSTEPFTIIFGIDQSPGDPRKAHWTKFLHQDTGVPFGAEKYAKEYGIPVCFGVIHKVRRGYYTFETRPLTETPTETKHGWILEEASRWLETEIRRVPPYWLWSHRRWKHAKPAEFGTTPRLDRV